MDEKTQKLIDKAVAAERKRAVGLVKEIAATAAADETFCKNGKKANKGHFAELVEAIKNPEPVDPSA